MIYTIFISHYIYSLIVAPIIDQINPSTQTLTVRENEQIHLQCVASGYPKPKITWRRDDDRPIHIDRIACMFSFSFCSNIFFSIINDGYPCFFQILKTLTLTLLKCVINKNDKFHIW